MRVLPTVASSPGRVSHYLAFLNSFWHSYPFSVRRSCPLTQISLLLKEQPVLASRQASVWKTEVFQTLILGLLELLPFGQALARSFTVSVSYLAFSHFFSGATNTNWEWQQMLLVVKNRYIRVGGFTFLLKLCGNLDLAKQLYNGILLHLKPFWHKMHSNLTKHFMLKNLRFVRFFNVLIIGWIYLTKKNEKGKKR